MNLQSLLEDTKDSTIEDFTCNLCNQLLSYFPIYLTSDCQNVCGRCAPPLGNLHFRNKVYENLSQTVKFPCRFADQGCGEELLPEDVPDHETSCKFRTIQCSLLECKWEGARPIFFDHCHDEHYDMFLKDKDSFKVDLSTCFHITRLLVLEKEHHVFVGEMKFDKDEKKLQIAVYYPKHEIDVDKNNIYSYEFCLQNGTTKLSTDLETTIFKDISFTELYPDFGKNIVRCCISLKETTLEFENNNQLNANLLSVLKCLSCQMFALPPIYQCSVAKAVLCSSCKKTHKCNYCTKDRNFALDNLAALVNYPCRHKERGCNFVGTPSETKKHTEICQYDSITCPFVEYNGYCACDDWNGCKKDFKDHVHSKHQNEVYHREYSSTFPRSEEYDGLFLENFGRLFFVECTYNEKKQRYCWEISTLNGGKNEIFEYQMEIFHSQLPDKVLVRKPCKQVQKFNLTDGNDFKDYVNIDQIGENALFKIKIL